MSFVRLLIVPVNMNSGNFIILHTVAGYCYVFISQHLSVIQKLVFTQTAEIFVFLMHIFSGFLYFMDCGSLDQGRVDHGS